MFHGISDYAIRGCIQKGYSFVLFTDAMKKGALLMEDGAKVIQARYPAAGRRFSRSAGRFAKSPGPDKRAVYFDKAVAILILLAVWESAPRLGLIDPFLIPPFSSVMAELARIVISGQIFIHMLSSFKRSFAGFSTAVLFSIPAGFLIAWSKTFARYLDPVLQVCRSIPILALYPVFILFFGLGEASKIAIIIYGSVWPTLLNTIIGVKGVDTILVKAAGSMGVSGARLFFKVTLPSALPSILTGIRLSAASSLLLLIAAEMMGAKTGLGFLIFYSEEKYDIAVMFAGIIAIAATGMLINHLLVRLEKRLTGWKQNARGK